MIALWHTFAPVGKEGVVLVLVASQILGLLGIALGLLGYLPQILHLIRQQCSAGISMQAYFVWLSAAVLLLIHALMINDAVSILLQSLAATLDLTSVVLGTKYRGRMCLLHREPDIDTSKTFIAVRL